MEQRKQVFLHGMSSKNNTIDNTSPGWLTDESEKPVVCRHAMFVKRDEPGFDHICALSTSKDNCVGHTEVMAGCPTHGYSFLFGNLNSLKAAIECKQFRTEDGFSRSELDFDEAESDFTEGYDYCRILANDGPEILEKECGIKIVNSSV